MAIASSSTDGNLMIITARQITGRYCSGKYIIFLDRSFPIGLARRQQYGGDCGVLLPAGVL